MAKVKNHLKLIKETIDLQNEEKSNLQSSKKSLTENLKTLTNDRDRAIEQKFLQSNEINDTKKISAQEAYNDGVEKKLLEEQRKFNGSKIFLEELGERVETVDRNLSCSYKKIEAVKREIEKVKKSRQVNQVPKPASIAKMFSNPPPVISNSVQGGNKVPTASRSGFLNFFRKN